MYQFVIDIRLEDDSEAMFLRCQAIEVRLEEIGGELFEVDGNEFGSGSYDIFLDTDHPYETLNAIKPFVTGVDWQAGFRAENEDDYAPVYPPQLQKCKFRYNIPND